MSHLIIDDFIDSSSLQKMRENLNNTSDTDWLDGKNTNENLEGKRNFQLRETHNSFKYFVKQVDLAVDNSSVVKEYALLKSIFGCLITRTDLGGKYPKHTDILFRRRNNHTVRADLSFTIFLNDPEEYDGGNLLIQNQGEFKLKSGSIIIYPSNEIHEVTEVTRGTRYVFIGWIESAVKSNTHRDLVWNFSCLDNSLRDLQVPREVRLQLEKVRIEILREFID